jgi:Ca-activated chloride channel homolog
MPSMFVHSTLTILVILLFLPLMAQTPQTTYSLSVAVNEVTLEFHASDGHGLPLNDLKLADLHILDNGLPPARVSKFQVLRDVPIRVAFLFDTSTSMAPALTHNREIALQFTQNILRQSSDQAFIANFGSVAKLVQPWTNDAKALELSLRYPSAYGERTRPGTALYDAVYQACHYQFAAADKASTSNLILLFSDGEDNASHFDLAQTVQACQHTHTAIYAFRTDSSLGASALAELSEKTGGRVFYDPAGSPTSKSDIYDDLRQIEAAQRNQYQLIYVPAQMRHDGTFHHVQLNASDLQDHIEVRSGYYAPLR